MTTRPRIGTNWWISWSLGKLACSRIVLEGKGTEGRYIRHGAGKWGVDGR